MQPTASIPCPFCGSETETSVDLRLEQQDFIIDCEVCCRPMTVNIACEDGEIVSVDVQAA